MRVIVAKVTPQLFRLLHRCRHPHHPQRHPPPPSLPHLQPLGPLPEPLPVVEHHPPQERHLLVVAQSHLQVLHHRLKRFMLFTIRTQPYSRSAREMLMTHCTRESAALHDCMAQR